MNLIIYINEEFEDEKALYHLDEKQVLLKGDQYHDQIRGKIDGYLEALEDFGIHEEEVDEVWIDKNHEHFKQIGFYCE